MYVQVIPLCTALSRGCLLSMLISDRSSFLVVSSIEERHQAHNSLEMVIDETNKLYLTTRFSQSWPRGLTNEAQMLQHNVIPSFANDDVSPILDSIRMIISSRAIKTKGKKN